MESEGVLACTGWRTVSMLTELIGSTCELRGAEMELAQ